MGAGDDEGERDEDPTTFPNNGCCCPAAATACPEVRVGAAFVVAVAFSGAAAASVPVVI